MNCLLACPYAMPESEQAKITAELLTALEPVYAQHGGIRITTAAQAVRDARAVDPGLGFSGFAQAAPNYFDCVIIVTNAEGLIGLPTADLVRSAQRVGRQVVLLQSGPALVPCYLVDVPNGRYKKPVPL